MSFDRIHVYTLRKQKTARIKQVTISRAFAGQILFKYSQNSVKRMQSSVTAFEVSQEMQILSMIARHSALRVVFKTALKFTLKTLIFGCVRSFG